LTAPLLATKIPKTPKVFNNAKVTDHHAIIPTGAAGPGGGMESSVYDIIARRFIAAFYPDCEVSNTTVLAEAAERPFRVRGRQILSPGWRVVYGNPEEQQAPTPAPAPNQKPGGEEQEDVVSTVLPSFVKGESGPHNPRLDSKVTQPPKDYTEASLLRGMETAGRNIDDEELRQAMKENGIGRPSTRAAIIETLFKRNYIRREKKRILPTPTGVELIGLIRNPTLKSAELTGQWERKLRQIEKGELSSEQFLSELTGLVREMVQEVKTDASGRAVTSGSAEQVVAAAGAKVAASKAPAGMVANGAALPSAAGLGYCPVCKSGHVLRGKTAFGCARFREGCSFRLPAEIHGKKLSDPQVKALLAKGRTPVMKGFVGAEGQKFDAAIGLDAAFQPALQLVADAKPGATPDSGLIPCPVCKLGTMLKGKAAFGCSRFREDCQFRVAFEWGGKALTETQLKQLLRRGETSVIKGFISAKTGKKYDAALKVEEGRVVPMFG
jgi:DNA topoisomerase-3